MALVGLAGPATVAAQGAAPAPGDEALEAALGQSPLAKPEPTLRDSPTLDRPIAGQAAILVLGHDDSEASLLPHLEFLHDPAATLTTRDAAVATMWNLAKISPLRESWGFVPGQLWFRFQVDNRSGNDDWLLVVDYPLLDRIELYVIAESGPTAVGQTGDRLPFASRAMPLRTPNLRLAIPSGQRREFLVRVESQGSMQLPLRLVRPVQLAIQEGRVALGFGIYFGILIALTAYNFSLYLMLHDRRFSWYVAYAASFGLLMLSLNGLAFQYLWPRWPDFGNLFVPLVTAVGLFTMCAFSRRFLELDGQAPHWARVLRALGVIALIGGVCALVIPYRHATTTLTFLALITAPAILGAAIASLNRLPAARYFLLAWLLLLMGISLYSLMALGLIDFSYPATYGIQIGSALELILLSFALAYRMRLLEAENRAILVTARGDLERRVAGRTRDLNQTLSQLETANAQLRESAMRDGLTGLPNRRYFNAHASESTQSPNRVWAQVALLMIDLDHFKRVNDSLGHLAGDECLRVCAQRMQPVIEAAGGWIARYGGEEFVAVLPDADLGLARRTAEALRSAIGGSPLVLGATQVRLTTSVGVAHSHSATLGTVDQLVDAADRALYRAKDLGRDRVEFALT